jgi:hypothetical protein
VERVEAIVERQQGMPSEGDDHGLFLPGQDEWGFLGPVGRSATEVRHFHLVAVF